MSVNSAHAFDTDFHDLNESEVGTILQAGKKVRGGAGYAELITLDISEEDPHRILAFSTVSFQYGIPDCLEDYYNLYPKLVLSDASVISKMIETFRNGKMFLPTGGETPDYKTSVVTVYDHLLNHFDWDKEKGYSTKIMSSEVAVTLVTRARLEKLKALWQ